MAGRPLRRMRRNGIPDNAIVGWVGLSSVPVPGNAFKARVAWSIPVVFTIRTGEAISIFRQFAADNSSLTLIPIVVEEIEFNTNQRRDMQYAVMKRLENFSGVSFENRAAAMAGMIDQYMFVAQPDLWEPFFQAVKGV
jgi:hypothetical protein